MRACFGCGDTFQEEDPRVHTRRHYEQQLAKVRAFMKEHGHQMTYKEGLHGRSPIQWNALCQEAISVYLGLLATVTDKAEQEAPQAHGAQSNTPIGTEQD